MNVTSLHLELELGAPRINAIRAIITAMTIDALIMLAGAIVAALPFLGFPHAWLQWLFFAIGVLTICLGIATRRRLGHKMTQQRLPFDETRVQ